MLLAKFLIILERIAVKYSFSGWLVNALQENEAQVSVQLLNQVFYSTKSDG